MMETVSWVTVSAAEVLLLWLYLKADKPGSGSRRKQTTPAPVSAPLVEFKLNRAHTSLKNDSDDSPPTLKPVPTKPNRAFPVGFSPYRRCKPHSASVSAESVSEQELAWSPSVNAPKDPETKARLERILANNILLTSLSHEGKATVVEAYERMELAKDVVLVREGDTGDCCYIVESGKLSCDMKDKGHRCDYNPGQTFGELALMYGNIRAATITVSPKQTLTPCVLWRLDRTIFKKIVLNAAQPNQHLFLDFIATVHIFSSLARKDKETMVTCSQHLLYRQGQILLETGHMSAERYVYLIKSGKVAIVADHREVEMLGPGEFFGEKAILYDECPMADAVAREESEVFRVPETVVMSCPGDFLHRLKEFARNRYE